MQDRNDAADRAERIAALQRLLAQALESGISARSVQDGLLPGSSNPGPVAAEQPATTP